MLNPTVTDNLSSDVIPVAPDVPELARHEDALEDFLAMTKATTISAADIPAEVLAAFKVGLSD